VRNITASELAGVDVDEPLMCHPMRMRCFNFLENPICQKWDVSSKCHFLLLMIKIALSYLHDLGFIPKIVNGAWFQSMLGED
jgi:sulfite reductase (ferredoxin)